MEFTTATNESAVTTQNQINLWTNSTTNITTQNTTTETVQYNTLDQNELNSIVNVTREYPFDYATIMFGYMMPFVLVLTIITNTLVVMVLSQRHMRTPTNIVLFTMAIVDLSTLLSPSPWYFYIYTLGYYDKFLYPPVACYFHHIMTDVIPVFFHTSSIWLALLLASQRYIYVCHPTLARTWCTVPRVKKAIFIILAVAFLHQLTRFFDNTFESIEVTIDDVKYPACKIEISGWVNRVNIAVYYTSYFTFRIMFVFIIPCVALITLNCLLFAALRRAENKRTELLQTKFRLLANERCSIAGLHEIKRPSYIENACNNQQAISEVSSTGFIMENQHTNLSSTSKITNQTPYTDSNKQLDNTKTSNDKSRKLSKALLAMKKQHAPKVSNKVKISSPTDTSDTKVISSNLEEQKKEDEANKGHKTIAKASEQRSDDSEVSCSVVSSQSKSDIVLNDKSKSRHNHRFQDKRSVEGLDSADCDDFDYDDEDCTCVECATCEADLDCQRCSGAARDRVSGDQPQCHRHDHRAESQCSSLVEGATNTITNDEDASSSAITQNATSSMYVIHGGNMDTVEISSMKEELANDTSDVQALTKSDSIESHLICGCLVPKSNIEGHDYKFTETGKRLCRDCCMLKGHYIGRTVKNRSFQRDVSYTGPQKLSKSNTKCTNPCSNSVPCINCNLNARRMRSSLDGEKSDMDAHNVKPILVTSQSDCEAGVNNKNLGRASNKSTPVCTNATTTTTTTTLYSTKTDSFGSLPQVQNQPSTTSDKRHSTQPTVPLTIQIKNPSIASTTGRGSRATLGGGCPSTIQMPGTLTTTATVSSRSMDSNRTTLMLIVVVTVFLLVEVPVAISHILHVVFNSFDVFKDIEFASYLNYIKLFTNFSIMISYSVNFTIYCSMSKKFRDTFRDLFLCARRSRRNHYQQQQSQYTQHHFNNQDTQLVVHSPDNANNIQTNHGIGRDIQNDTASGSNRNNAGVLRYSPYKRESDQQQECEL